MIFWILLAITLIVIPAIVVWAGGGWNALGAAIVGPLFMGLFYGALGALFISDSPAGTFHESTHDLVSIGDEDGVYVVGDEDGYYTFLYDDNGEVVSDSVSNDQSTVRVADGTPTVTIRDGYHAAGLWYPWDVQTRADEYVFNVPEGAVVESYELGR